MMGIRAGLTGARQNDDNRNSEAAAGEESKMFEGDSSIVI